MDENSIRGVVLKLAKKSFERGPGWAQESIVFREVRDHFRQSDIPMDQKTEHAILEAWHDLFLDKKLAWGYDLDNPNSPFFHVR